jgi:hypothetical protein
MNLIGFLNKYLHPSVISVGDNISFCKEKYPGSFDTASLLLFQKARLKTPLKHQFAGNLLFTRYELIKIQAIRHWVTSGINPLLKKIADDVAPVYKPCHYFIFKSYFCRQ